MANLRGNVRKVSGYIAAASYYVGTISHTDAVSEPQKDTVHWFKSGDIVLVARDEKTAEETAYRVHTEILSRQSHVFSDLLSVPQPRDQDLIEGCPVIFLSDEPHDISILLALIYNGWAYVPYKNSNTDYER